MKRCSLKSEASNGNFFVVSSHMTYDGLIRRVNPDLGSALPLTEAGLGSAFRLCGWSRTVVVWCLTDRHCVRERLIDSMTMSQSASGSPCSVDYWSSPNLKHGNELSDSWQKYEWVSLMNIVYSFLTKKCFVFVESMYWMQQCPFFPFISIY